MPFCRVAALFLFRLVQALQQILDDPEYRDRQGERARNSVVTHNRSSDRANSVLMLFEQIVGRDSLPMPQ